jgi:hypothetical protein
LASMLRLQAKGIDMATMAVVGLVMAGIVILVTAGDMVDQVIVGTAIMATVAVIMDIVAIIMADIITAIMEVMGIVIIITTVMEITTITGMIMDGKLLPSAWERLLWEAQL